MSSAFSGLREERAAVRILSDVENALSLVVEAAGVRRVPLAIRLSGVCVFLE